MTINRAFDFASIRLYNTLYRWASRNNYELETQEQLEKAALNLAKCPALGMGSKTYAELLVVCGLLHWANRCWLRIPNSERKALIRGYAKELYAESRKYGDWYDDKQLVVNHIAAIVEKQFG